MYAEAVVGDKLILVVEEMVLSIEASRQRGAEDPLMGLHSASWVRRSALRIEIRRGKSGIGEWACALRVMRA